MATVVSDGSDFGWKAKELLEYRPRWRDGFQDDAWLLGLLAIIGLTGAATRYGQGSDEGWLMAFVGFACGFAAFAQRRVLVEAPVWLVSGSGSGLPIRVIAAGDAWSSKLWRDPRWIALDIWRDSATSAWSTISFRRIGVTRCYVDRDLLPRVRATDWREEFEVSPLRHSREATPVSADADA